VYAATVNEQRLSFEVECVWRRNMIMRDRETGTLWQHATGEALIGPLQGASLTLLGGELVTWAGWIAAHPYTLAALEPSEWKGMVSKEKVTKVLERATNLVTLPGITQTDTRLPAREAIVGILIDSIARAYRLADLKERGHVDETIGGQKIRIVYDENQNMVRAFRDGTQMHVQRTWWAGWYEFHPKTTIFEIDRK